MGWQEGAEGRGRWQRVAGPFVSCHDAGCVQATGHGALCDLRDRNAAGSLVSPLFLEDEAGQVGKEWSCKESLQSHPIPAARVFGASWKRFPSLWWEPLRPDLSSMAGRDPSMPKLAWTEEEEAKVNAPPAQQPYELTEVQVLQAGERLSWAEGLAAASCLCPLPSSQELLSHVARGEGNRPNPWDEQGEAGRGQPSCGYRPLLRHGSKHLVGCRALRPYHAASAGEHLAPMHAQERLGSVPS